MRYPPSFIERLRNHFLISEVVGRRIPLKKHGREFQALCPFHNEKSPSFTVNDEKGFFHCFGCQEHGDTIAFVMKHERLTYPEAIEKLAREAGMPLPEQSPEEHKRYEREKTLFDVIEAATHWFESQLASAAGASARDYIEKRGLKPETQRIYRIGYAPDDKTALHQYLLKMGFAKQLQQDAGLISVSDEGHVYDRFRGRIIFPIRNARGLIIAFGGRLIGIGSTNKHLPKYLNSPETVLFKKGEMLYNLDLAKRPAREHNIVVVMEGYMDVVSTSQSGIAYAVATLGTAVTAEHLRLLWQIAKEPVICLDGDAAGKRAMLRAAELALPLLMPGYSLRFALLPKGEDPDTYITKHGKASFEKILMSSKRLSQTLWDVLQSRYRLDLPEGRAALEDACKKLGNTIGDATVRQHYLSYFRKQLWAKPATDAKPANARSAHVERMVIAHHSAPLDALIRSMFKLLMKFPGLLHTSAVEETLPNLDISNHTLDALRDVLLAAIEEPGIDNHDQLAAYIGEHLPGYPLDKLEGEALPASYQTPANIEEARLLWNKIVANYQYAHLEMERKELEENLGHTVHDEADYQHKLARLMEIKRLQAGRTFAPAESDIA